MQFVVQRQPVMFSGYEHTCATGFGIATLLQKCLERSPHPKDVAAMCKDALDELQHLQTPADLADCKKNLVKQIFLLIMLIKI